MTIEEELQNYILSKYKSIMQFSKASGLPYTTVKGIFNRGFWGTSIQNIVKMCDTLSIDLNSLVYGDIREKDNIVDNPSEHEKKVILAYRKTPEMKNAVDRLLKIDDDTIRLLKIARSNDSKVTYINDDDVSDLYNAEITDDDL